MKRPDEEMRKEYDFFGGERGKYVERLAKGANVVFLDPDVADVFPDSASVNQTLRALAGIIRSQKSMKSHRTNKPTESPSGGMP